MGAAHLLFRLRLRLRLCLCLCLASPPSPPSRSRICKKEARRRRNCADKLIFVSRRPSKTRAESNKTPRPARGRMTDWARRMGSPLGARAPSGASGKRKCVCLALVCSLALSLSLSLSLSAPNLSLLFSAVQLRGRACPRLKTKSMHARRPAGLLLDLYKKIVYIYTWRALAGRPACWQAAP